MPTVMSSRRPQSPTSTCGRRRPRTGGPEPARQWTVPRPSRVIAGWPARLGNRADGLRLRLQQIARKRAPTSQRLRSASIGLGISALLHEWRSRPTPPGRAWCACAPDWCVQLRQRRPAGRPCSPAPTLAGAASGRQRWRRNCFQCSAVAGVRERRRRNAGAGGDGQALRTIVHAFMREHFGCR